MSIESAVRVDESGYGHALLSATETDGRVVREAVPVSRIEADLVAVLGSPAYLTGFAAGDVLKVGSDHSFEVVARGGNVCVQVFADPPLTGEAIDALESAFASVGGEVESPGHRRFAVVTVPSAAGASRIADVMATWSDRVAGRTEWQFGSPVG